MAYKLLGNRVPYEYFITTGKGESSVGSKGLPYETGSYDAALNDAGIEDANIVLYTSVIPTGAKEITHEEGLKRLNWGEVLECIMAQTNGKRGETISAAVMTTSIIDPNGKYLGSFACEYSGSGSRKVSEDSLGQSIAGMIKRRGYGNIKGETQMYKDNITDKGYIIHPGKKYVYEELHIKELHGTVFATICFISYKYPILNERVKLTGPIKMPGLKNKTMKKRRGSR
uniref:arginine decarboxylase n=1 Tax=viral metagenome TaxID=1070528 RepID=A0A6C0F031_9ZZZZ